MGGYIVADNIENYFPSKEFKLPLKNNNINIKLYNQKDHTYIYNVFMCFDSVKIGLGNQHSGKHNFHELGEINKVISDFKSFLNEAINY